MMSVNCPACGTANDPGSQYCRQCARRLDDETRNAITQQRLDSLSSQRTGIRWMPIVVTGLVVIIVVVLVLVLVIR